MTVCGGPPRQILHHATIFVLAGAVIGVEVCHLLTEPVCLQKVVKPADDVISIFATLSCLISEETDLAREGLTVHPKHSTLPWCHKVNQPWLEGIKRNVYLLCIVKRIMHLNVVCVWSDFGS